MHEKSKMDIYRYQVFFLLEMRNSGFVIVSVTDESYDDMLRNRIIPSMADKLLGSRVLGSWVCKMLLQYIL